MKRSITAIVFLFSLSLFAQPPQDTGELQFSLGLGVLTNDDGYLNEDTDSIPIPLIDLRYKRFFIQGIDIGVEVVKQPRFTWKILVRPEFTDLEVDDDAIYTGLEDRDMSIMIGSALDYDLGNRFSISFRADTDISGNSEGAIAELGISRLFLRPKTIFIPSVTLKWESEDYNNYYYGVSLPEASRSVFSAYAPDSGIGGEVGFLVRHQLGERMELVGLGGYEWLSGEIEDSPLVDASGTYTALLGVAWKIR